MRILAIFCFCFFVSFGLSFESLYQKAQDLENKGEVQRAMEIYKKIAQDSINLMQNLNNEAQISSTLFQESNLTKNPNLTQKSQISDFVTSDEISQDENLTQNLQGSNLAKTSKNQDPLDKFDDIFDIDYYEPMFFLWSQNKNRKNDRQKGEAKFQFSFHKPFLSDILGLDETYNFAYTQTSWWQIKQNSSPFRESNYRPEFFVKFPIKNPHLNSLKIGLLHESNGKDKEQSRSWNKIYLSSNFDFENLKFRPRIWYPFLIDETNKDIAKYFGYGDLMVEYLHKKSKFSLEVRNNLKFKQNRGAVQFSWEYMLKNGLNLYLQYFSGYGENMMDYKDSVDKISIGFSIAK